MLITGLVLGCLGSQLGPGQPARAAWRLACAPADLIQRGLRGRPRKGPCWRHALRSPGAKTGGSDSGGGQGGESEDSRLVSSVDPQLELA